MISRATKRVMRNHVLWIAALAFVLAACNGNGSTPPPDNQGRLVEVNLTIVGGPVDADGLREPTSVAVRVHDTDGGLVHFDSDSVATTDGDETVLHVPPGTGSLTLFLPEGHAYTFKARASDSADHLISFGTAVRTTAAGGTNAVALRLESLLGDAELYPRLPVQQLLPGQEIDLLFRVTPSERPDLSVPSREYEAQYDAGNATVLSYDGRGARFRTGERQNGDFTVTATATGILKAVEPKPGAVTSSIRIPFSTNLAVDLDAPDISTLAFDPVRHVFTGVAEDDFGIAILELYDGPVPLATTDLDVIETTGLPEIVFPGGGTAFVTELSSSLPAGTYDLTVKASDFSGNEGTAEITVVVP